MATATKTDKRVLMTSDEFAVKMDIHPVVAKPMIKALRDKGKIKPVGKTKVLGGGRPFVIYHFPAALVKALF